METISGLDKMIRDVSIRVKGFLYPHKVSLIPAETTHTASSGVRLLKPDVPTFNLHWGIFWEQFCIAVHDCTHLSFLRHALNC